MTFLVYNSQLSEKDKPYVDIQGLTASTMEILLDFVYTETVHVTVENVQELLPAACLLQLKGNNKNNYRSGMKGCWIFVFSVFEPYCPCYVFIYFTVTFQGTNTLRTQFAKLPDQLKYK